MATKVSGKVQSKYETLLERKLDEDKVQKQHDGMYIDDNVDHNAPQFTTRPYNTEGMHHLLTKGFLLMPKQDQLIYSQRETASKQAVNVPMLFGHTEKQAARLKALRPGDCDPKLGGGFIAVRQRRVTSSRQ